MNQPTLDGPQEITFLEVQVDAAKQKIRIRDQILLELRMLWN